MKNSKTKIILHLSHTDINSDSRILKSMSVAKDAGYSVIGIGLETKNSGVSSVARVGVIQTKRLSSRRLTLLPAVVRHGVSFVEALLRVFPAALRAKPHLIHCHDTLMLPISVMLKIFLRCRLIYDAHELESDRNGLTPELGRLTLWIETLSWSLIDALVVVSPAIGDWYNYTIGRKKTVVVLNSPSMGKTVVCKSDYLRRRFGIPDNKTIYIYIGIVGRGRGIDHIIKAFEKISSDAALVFLGFGEYEERLRALGGNRDAGIYFHEAVPHERVVQIASSADVGLCMVERVSLSDYLCLPNKLFEYAFSGVPVVASNFPEIARVVAQFKLGVCAEFDIESLRDAMVTVASKRERVTVGALFALSWQAQAARLSALYDELLLR